MPNGGKRPGAGRPPGKKNALPQGCVAAIKAANLRVPQDAPEAHRDLANRALVRIAEVMESKVSPLMAFSVLTAARGLREEVCGPIPRKHEVTGKDGGSLVVEVIRYADARPASEQLPAEAVSTPADGEP